MEGRAKYFLVGLSVVTVLMFWHASARQQQVQIQSAAISWPDTPFAALPEQYATSKSAFKFKQMTIQPLAEFRIRARILSRENYYFGPEATISPLDLALGWQRMADPQVYQALNIRQSGRWYRYSWQNEPPIPLREIIESSANMHMIPANDEIKQILERAKAGQFIKLQGQLVEVRRDDGWHWRSSLTRSDSGNGACELIFVEAAVLE